MTKIAVIVNARKTEGELEIQIIGLLGAADVEPIVGTKMIKDCVYNEYNMGRLEGIGINQEMVVIVEFYALDAIIPKLRVADIYPEAANGETNE